MEKLNLRFIVLGFAGLFVLFLILVFTGIIPGLKKTNTTPQVKGEIILWTMGPETPEYAHAWENLLTSFRSRYPGISVIRKNFTTLKEYETALSDSFGSKDSPDVFMVQNTALPRYQNKLVPAPSEIFSVESLRNLFPKVVENDFVSAGNVYGLPLSIDTLALIYNRNYIDQAAISVPQTWDDLSSATSLMTKSDASGITIAGAALGGSMKNIENAADISGLFMMQNAATMTDPDHTRALFNDKRGADALRFYMQFSDRTSATYTWNETMPNAQDLFSQEKVAMLIDYYDTLKNIKKKNPFLDMNTAETPAPESLVTGNRRMSFARYFSLVVSRQSLNPNVGWIFISSLTTDEPSVKAYLNATDIPPALRSIALSLKNDPKLGVFARQTLTANSWYQIDNRLIDQTFSEMIKSVAENRKSIETALSDATSQISKAMQKNP